MTPFLTYAIIGITAITSIKAFNDTRLRQRMLFNPYIINKERDLVRFLSSGFIHADYMHLIVNMYVLYAFGQWVELYFNAMFGTLSGFLFIALYVLGIIISHTTSYFKQRKNPYYNSLGASGAVSAILFAAILLLPDQKIYFIFLPGLGIPAWGFGLLYLGYSQYMSHRGTGNINHDAHFAGAVFGFLFTGVLKPALFQNFIEQILS